MRLKKKKKNDPMREDVTMMRMRTIAVVIAAEMIAPMTEEIALMIEETVPTIDGGMMIVDIIVVIVHAVLTIEGGEETTMTIAADPDTMMMTVTDAIDAVLVPGTDILLDPTLVSAAVDTSLDYFQSLSDSKKSDGDCRERSLKMLLVRCYSHT